MSDEHPLLHNEEGVDTEDHDPANMMLRAGYLVGMSLKCEKGSDDRKMLQRAARSLVIACRRATAAEYAPAMAALLLEVHGERHDHCGRRIGCPFCSADTGIDPHDADCRLDAVLRAAGVLPVVAPR